MYLLLCKLFPLPRSIITEVNTEIPLNVSPDLCRRVTKMTSYTNLHNQGYLSRFSLLAVLCRPRNATSILLTKLPYSETFRTIVNWDVHTPSAIFISALGHDPLTILLIRWSLKFFTIANSFSTFPRFCPSEKVFQIINSISLALGRGHPPP